MSQPSANVLRRQPVEELGVAGRFTLRAELLAGLDDSDPEISCQSRFTATRAVSGLSGIDDPTGQPEAVEVGAGGAG